MSALLAIDTATPACSVAVWRDGDIVESFELAPQSHTGRLLPMIHELLAQCGMHLSQLDAIALTSGPGSFTGLRIGLGAVQGLAYGAALPVIPVSTLAVMAAGARRLLSLPDRALVIPALDARMAEVYWAVYDPQETEPRVIETDAVSGPADLMKEIVPVLRERGQPLVGVGNGWALEAMDTGALTSAVEDFYPHAEDVAALAAAALNRGETRSVFEVQPTYIRNEVSWKKRRRIRS